MIAKAFKWLLMVDIPVPNAVHTVRQCHRVAELLSQFKSLSEVGLCLGVITACPQHPQVKRSLPLGLPARARLRLAECRLVIKPCFVKLPDSLVGQSSQAIQARQGYISRFR